ncbi:MAG: hypothetical protein R3D60_06885 [Paracoccaceae bacterium]
MSAVMRDGTVFPGEPPLTRAARPRTAANDWQWPDPVEVVPPNRAPQAAEGRWGGATPIAARWPVEPLPSAWPPLPEEMSDHTGSEEPAPAMPSASYSPDFMQARATGGYTVSLPDLQDTLRAIPDEPQTRSDPSPSRLAYRLNRWWLTPTIRYFVRVGLPVLLVLAFIGFWLSDAGRRASIVDVVMAVRASVVSHPQFQVTSIRVESRSPDVAAGVEQILAVRLPVSSFDLDLAALRAQAEALDVVDRASVVVRSGGVLEVRIDERMPAMVWRHAGGLDLVAATGHRVARLATRDARADLPLIVGAGAPAAISEARLLWAAALPLRDRMPRSAGSASGAGMSCWIAINGYFFPPKVAGALERVIALDAAQDCWRVM